MKSHRILLGTICITLTAKLLFCAFILAADSRRFYAADSPGYENNARALLEAGVFASSPEHREQPETLRTPGYPVFLALLYRIFFPDPIIVVLAQILISTASLLIVYWIARSLWGQPSASLAIVLFALDIGFFAYSLILMTETLFTFLLLCFFATLIPLLRVPEKANVAFFSGLFLALATMVRPVSYYLFFPLFFGLIFVVVRKRTGWKGLYSPLFFLLPFLLIAGAWQTRNYLLTGYATLSRIQGDLLRKKSAEVVAMRDNITFEEAENKIASQHQKSLPSGNSTSPEKIDRFWQKQGLLYLMQYPSHYFRKEGKRALRIFAPSGHRMFELFGHSLKWWPLRSKTPNKFIRTWIVKHPGWLIFTIFLVIHMCLLYAGGILAIRFGWKRRPIRSIHIFYAGVFVYFLLISLAIGFQSRFLLPAMPLLHLYAARAITLWKKL